MRAFVPVAARIRVPLVVVLASAGVAGLALSSCGRIGRNAGRPYAEELEVTLGPAQMARTLKQLEGARFRATTTYEITTPALRERGDTAKDTVVTTTDVVIDKNGNYRMTELNDRDGGREVVLHGRNLAVGMRYGKLIRRPAREPEPTKLLEEALGSPYAAWEVMRAFARVSKQEDKSTGVPTLLYRFTKASERQAIQARFASTSPLRQWRDTIQVDQLSGAVRLDVNKVFISGRFDVTFSLQRGEEQLVGLIRVEAFVRDRGAVPAVAAPVAETLEARPRPILEERALLGRAAGDSAAGTPRPAARGGR